MSKAKTKKVILTYAQAGHVIHAVAELKTKVNNGLEILELDRSPRTGRHPAFVAIDRKRERALKLLEREANLALGILLKAMKKARGE